MFAFDAESTKVTLALCLQVLQVGVEIEERDSLAPWQLARAIRDAAASATRGASEFDEIGMIKWTQRAPVASEANDAICHGNALEFHWRNR